MEPQEFIEIRTRRYMAQALEEFEVKIEQPIAALASAEPDRQDVAKILAAIPRVKRTFRKKLLDLGSDCFDVMRSDVEINAMELVRR